MVVEERRRSRRGRAAARAGLRLLILALLPSLAPSIHAGESHLSVEVGAGHDDNPFETPSSPYYDQFHDEFVDPDKRSGFFVPLTVDGDYLLPDGRHRFLLDYRLRHESHGGNSNADETYVSVSPGYEMVTERKGGLEDRFFALPFARYRKELYFDRDTGVGETIGLEDASKRYTYMGTGAEVGFSSEASRSMTWEVSGSYEQRDYEDVKGLDSLDQDRLQVGSDVSFRLSRRLRYSFDYAYRILDYDERRSRDLDGGITSNGTPVTYTYHVVGNTLRFKPSSPWWLYFDLDYYRRDDRFEGYNDYHMLGERVRAIWNNGTYRVRASLRFWQRDYPRAFIFDMVENPRTTRRNPNKEYDILDASVLFEAPLVRDVQWFAETELRRQDAADPRFTYDDLRISAGVRWDFEWRTE